MSRRRQENKEYVTVTKKLDIPEEKLADYREAFNMFDKNKKGSIGGNEIQKIIRIVALCPDGNGHAVRMWSTGRANSFQ